MTSVFSRTPFDFVKLKELDKKDDRYDENVNLVSEENGLYRKKIPKGSDSLMRAVSEVLYFTCNHAAEIQQSLLKYLTQLIASNKLTARLNNFQGNSLLLKDFSNNPHLTGFEKTNLELVSSLFRVRVILYTMNEDHYLTATIFNNNYPNTIEILRTKSSHYDPIFPKEFIKKAGVCQNIILNLIDKAVNGVKATAPLKNLNNDEYVNITFESAQTNAAAAKESSPLDQFRITRGHHKKSLSDNFNTNFEIMEEQQMKFYDAFMNAGPPDDFLKSFGNRKDTAESNFSINANFDFIDDQNLDHPFQGNNEFSIKNYPITSGQLSPRAPAGLELDSPMPAFSKAKFSSHPNVLFNENLSLAEIERLEKSANTATTLDPKHASSPFYRNASPPGLSPTKFSQRTFTDSAQTPKSDLFSPSPTISRDNMQNHPSAFTYNSASPGIKRNLSNSPYVSGYSDNKMYSNQRQFSEAQIQPFAPQSQQLSTNSSTFTLQPQSMSSMYLKRNGSVGASGTIQGVQPQQDEFNLGQYDQFEQGGEFDGFGQAFGGQPREKKKPIILDESKERYVGRLKFFDENKKYGFIVMEDDGSDIFVHYDDLIKAGISKDLLRTARLGNLIRLTFGCMAYIGKYNRSRKAIDIQLIM